MQISNLLLPIKRKKIDSKAASGPEAPPYFVGVLELDRMFNDPLRGKRTCATPRKKIIPRASGGSLDLLGGAICFHVKFNSTIQ